MERIDGLRCLGGRTSRRFRRSGRFRMNSEWGNSGLSTIMYNKNRILHYTDKEIIVTELV